MSLLRFWKSILFFAILLLISLMPATESDEPMKKIMDIGIDKFKHVAAFGLLYFLLIYEFSGNKITHKNKLKHLATLFFVASFGGILIEILQFSFPSLGRTFNPVDIFANTIGAALVMLVFFASKIKSL